MLIDGGILGKSIQVEYLSREGGNGVKFDLRKRSVKIWTPRCSHYHLVSVESDVGWACQYLQSPKQRGLVGMV